MKHYLWIAALFGAAISAWSQSQDSLKNEVLNEVVVFDAANNPVTQQLTVEEVLSVYKGVTLINRGQYGKDLVYRGLSADRLNVTLDGMRVFGACTDRMDPITSYVETGNLASIESNHGGGGGTNGINLQLVKPKSNQLFKARASTYANLGVNGYGYSLNASASYQNHQFLVQFSQRKHDNYSMPNGEKLAFTGYSKTNGRLYYAISLKDWKLSFDGIADLATDIGYAGLPMDVSKAEAAMASVGLERSFEKGTWLKFKGYANSVFHVMDDSNREVLVHMDMPGWSTTYGGFVEGGKQVNRWKISVKAEGFRNYRRAEMTMYQDFYSPMFMLTWPDTKWTSGVLSTRFVRESDRFTHSFGGLISYQDMMITDSFGADQWAVFGFEDLGRSDVNFSGDYSFDFYREKSRYNFSAQYSSRAPGVSERYGFYLYNANDGYDYLGNPDLKTESILQFSAQHSINLSGWSITSQVFANLYNEYIFGQFTNYSGMTLGAKGVRQYQNIGTAQQVGVNSIVVKEFSSGITLKNTLDYQWSTLEDGSPIPLTLPLRNQLSVSYSYLDYTVSVRQMLAGKKGRVNSELAEFRTDGYQTTDVVFSANFEYSKITLEVSLGVANMFNMAYVDAMDWRPLIHPGRNYFIQLTFGL